MNFCDKKTRLLFLLEENEEGKLCILHFAKESWALCGRSVISALAKINFLYSLLPRYNDNSSVELSSKKERGKRKREKEEHCMP